MVEVYINNQLIDLEGAESIDADYSNFDLSKLLAWDLLPLSTTNFLNQGGSL